MKTKYDELMLDPEFRRLDAIEALIADTSQMIADLLEQRNMKQADLARSLKKTPAFVSQLLNGKANLTLRTLAEVAHALGVNLSISAESEHGVKEANQRGSEAYACRTRLPLRSAAFTFELRPPKHYEPAEWMTRTHDIRGELVA